jgi:hypothetical protein
MISLNNIAEELSKADFGDKRLSCRLGMIAEQLGEEPANGFPVACGSDSSLEGLYRFLGNDRVTAEKILLPHIQGTCERMASCKKALVIHDSSCFIFPGEDDREGLYRYSKFKQGFWGHFAVSVSHKGSHPLGVVGMATFLRDGSKSKQSKKKRAIDPNRESTRWFKLVKQVEDHNVGRAQLIHVMDREADNNEILRSLISNDYRFVIRVRTSRKLTAIDSTGFKEFFKKDVLVSARKDPGCPHERKFYPPRESRVASLSFLASAVLVAFKKNKKEPATEMEINVVIAKEESPPQGEKPVEWILFTTEPIETPREVEEIVDIYRKRWLIEEFFKALKTGCNYEKRQLESKKTLLNALAVFCPLAAQMLLLRSLSRTDETLPLNAVLTRTQIEVLRRFSRIKLPMRLSTQSALRGIAAMGGHLRSNGPPGWIVLGRGFDKLMTLEMAWVAAKQGCDR